MAADDRRRARGGRRSTTSSSRAGCTFPCRRARSASERRDGLPRQPLARLLGRADAVQPADGDLRRRHRHPDRRVAGDRPAVGRGVAAAAHLRHGSDLGDHHARGALRRHDVRRHDHLGADQHAGRVGVGRDLHRRLPDGAAGASRCRARHRRDRLVHRRHDRRRPADAGVAGAGALVARLRPARDLRAAAARPDHRHPAHRRERAEGLHQHGARPDDRDGRLRHHLGRPALRLRRPGADGRHRLPAGRDRPVRHRRGPRRRRGRGRRGDSAGALRLARRHADGAGLAASSRWAIARGTVLGFLVGILPGAGPTVSTFLSYARREEGLEAPRSSSAAARSRASPAPSRPTTPPRPARWCRC